MAMHVSSAMGPLLPSTLDQGSATSQSTSAVGLAKIKATVKLGGLAVDYDGQPHAATATTSPSGLTVDFTYNGSGTAPTSVGKYTVVATIDDPNYQGSATGTLVISEGKATVVLGNLAATFDGNPHAATATTTPSGLTVDFTYDRKSTVPSAAGFYAVVGTVNDPNYVGSSTGTLVISNATITLGNLASTYSGGAQPATVVTDPAGLKATLTYNGKATSPVNVGSYAVVATVNTGGEVARATGTLAISPADATVTVNNRSAIYTGKPIAATAVTVPAKLPVSFTYDGSGTAPTVTGTYTVVGTVTNPNYTGSGTGTLTITPVPPTAVSAAATAITTGGANLNGTVDPKGSATTVVFEYGTTTAYGSTTPGIMAGSGDANVKVSTPISGLAYGTLYHFRAVAQTAASTVDGADLTFRTLGPTFALAPAAPLFSASGTQVGFGVTPNGVATSVYFKYSTDPTFGTYSETAPQSIGAGKAEVVASAFFGELLPSTTYYYEIVTTSSAGMFVDPIGSFVTPAFTTSLIVKTGDTANGTGGGTYDEFGDVAINSNNDGIAFAASLKITSSITSTMDLGIWANQGTGTLDLVALTGQAAPGITGGIFATLADPVYNENSQVAFGALIDGATATSGEGVWSTSSGTLSLVAEQGNPAPGRNGATLTAFSALDAVGLSDDNTIVIANLASGVGVTSANDLGIWEGTLSSNLTLLLQTGDVVGGETISGVELTSAQPLLEGQTRDFASHSGDLAVLAFFLDKTTGIVTSIGGAEALACEVGEPAPGTGGATFSAFSSPIINNSDHIAFEATLAISGGVTKSTNAGIWAGGSGALQLVARTGQVGTSFLTLSDPLDNDNDVTAFAATYKSGATTETGLFCSNQSGPVAETHQQAPGCSTGVFFSTFNVMALADSGGESNDGGLVFEATVTGTGVTTANNKGIWAVDSTGTPQLVMREGDIFNVPVNGTPSYKRVSELAFLPYSLTVDGQTRTLAKNEDMAITVVFSDKTNAIFRVQF